MLSSVDAADQGDTAVPYGIDGSPGDPAVFADAMLVPAACTPFNLRMRSNGTFGQLAIALVKVASASQAVGTGTTLLTCTFSGDTCSAAGPSGTSLAAGDLVRYELVTVVNEPAMMEQVHHTWQCQ